MTTKILMYPALSTMMGARNGIARVVEAYAKYMPLFGYEFIEHGSYESYDLKVCHAGVCPDADIAAIHGLYWTGDEIPPRWELNVNREVIAAVRYAKEVTVPSRWVQEAFQRGARISPHIVPHGIDWQDWQHNYQSEGYILWNKNRDKDVCNPIAIRELSRRFRDHLFVTTFAPHGSPNNVRITGVVDHAAMKEIVQRAGVYLSTTKETFGIGVLEALASGVPVLGYAHGGNLDLVEHGVNGYLARPNNPDDLADGLSYCLQYRNVLSENARETVKKWSWMNSCEIIDNVYKLAQRVERPTVSVVIPSYNYADKVGRAVQSAIDQDYRLLENIIVVDDGSDDGGETERVVRKYSALDKRVMYIRQDNQGVSAARNNGIELSGSKYISCLDADDAIAPSFLRVCVEELERDRSIGIAYTGLWYIKPDGTEGLSPWPGKFDYDGMLERRNSVPTCCVFRKSAWERVGGYKSRYAVGGAGSEDAEFFLRMGAYGFGAKKVTDEGLFIYSWLSGRVSGDRNYREVDWTTWHPWTKDKKHPFVSVARPENGLSHPVYQVDEPIVSVIIPVGPGHSKNVIDALDSLEAQTFRNWEAIVVWDNQDDRSHLEIAYPYAEWVTTVSGMGAGYARNRGAEVARAPLLLFLDADDWLYPEAMERLVAAHRDTQAIIYTDYVGKAFIDEGSLGSFGERLLHYDSRIGEAVIRHYSFDYDYDKAVRQPDRDFYIWNLITSIVPAVWHDEIGGFDEKMPSWEDWDYWIRMAKAGKCFERIPEDLVVYRFYTGGRRDLGARDNQTLVQYLQDKYKDIEVKMCNCKKNRNQSVPPVTVTQRDNIETARQMSNDDLVFVEYLSLNRGQHKVVGPATKKFLGYRAGGEKFYVPRTDAERAPNLFKPILRDSMIVRAEIEAPAPPAPVVSQAVSDQPVEQSSSIDDTRSSIFPEGKPEPVEQKDQEQHDGAFNVFMVPGVTPTIAVQLEEMHVESYEDLITIGEARLMLIRGMSQNRARTIVEYAKQIVASTPKPEVQDEITNADTGNVETVKPAGERRRAKKFSSKPA